MILYRKQRKQDYDNALTEFVAISSDFPWIAETYIYLGQTFTRLGILEPEDNLNFFDSAINSFKKASELGPTLSFPYVGMARTYLKIEGCPQIRDDDTKRTEAINNAEICVDVVLKEEPDNTHALLAKFLKKELPLRREILKGTSYWQKQKVSLTEYSQWKTLNQTIWFLRMAQKPKGISIQRIIERLRCIVARLWK
jgi:tetratricopeptide (TPR) repeat protein